MSSESEDFEGISSNAGIVQVGTTSIVGDPIPSTGGLVSPPAYVNTNQPFYAPFGGGGGGGVSSVSGTTDQILVANGTSNAIISMASVGTSGLKSNVSSITTDAQGRVTASTSLGYTPANPANFVPVTGGVFTGAVSGITPTQDANFTTKQYVDSQIVIGGGVQSVTATDSSVTVQVFSICGNTPNSSNATSLPALPRPLSGSSLQVTPITSDNLPFSTPNLGSLYPALVCSIVSVLLGLQNGV
jgi:hypothetical protein